MTALRSLASDARTRTRVILTLRADFLDRPLAVQSFGDLLRPGVVMLTAPSAEGLAAAITLPAQRVGVDLEPGLESEIMRDVIDQPGGLPLLEYSLTRLFERVRATPGRPVDRSRLLRVWGRPRGCGPAG